ncbi:MAG TPA: hypothetical protein VM781_02415 [Candidatus Bathyarchaeia archaeon]|nr:hypothetical protein [Candidatus Bathyarchaeia archaeon]
MTDTAPAVTPPAPDTSWVGTYKDADLGYIQNRGLDKHDLATAFSMTMKAHQEAQTKLGIPSDQIFHAPKGGNDVEGWNRFDARFNVPIDGKYDFSNVKFADGTELDEGFTSTVASALKSAHVSKDFAPAVAKALVDYMDKAEIGDAAERTAKLDADRMDLKTSWGPRFAPNMIIAKNVVKTLGLSPEFVNNIEKDLGYTATMKTLLELVSVLGEDKFVEGINGNQPYSAEGAQAILDQKQKDVEWLKKFNAGDTVAVQEFHNLTSLIATQKSGRR